jgi:hypothetical protein
MAVTPPPSANQVPVRLDYTASGIVFAKATAENLAIANTQSGIGTLNDVIEPVTFAQGLINITNGSTAITGTDTFFTSDFSAGQFLFYYDNEGDPVLAGKIASIANDVSMTLTANATVTKVLVNCGMSSIVLSTSDNILIRIPVALTGFGPNVAVIPNWNVYKNLVTGFNNTLSNTLEQYSTTGTPQVAATPPLVNIPYTITPVYNFQSFDAIVNGQRVTLYWQAATNFPSFCFAVFNPNGDADTKLAATTLYKLFASETFPLNGIRVTLSYNPGLLSQAGY